MHFRGFLATLAVASALALLPPRPAAAQTLTTYDTFNSEQMDGDRWTGTEHVIRYGSPSAGWSNQIERQWTHHPEFSVVNTRVDRRAAGGQLRLLLGTRGGTHDNTMAPGHGRLDVSAKPADEVTRIQARVTINTADVQPCRAAGESRVRAQLYLDVARDSELATRLMFVTLSLERSSFGGNRIIAVLSRCLDAADCFAVEDLDWVVFTRSWTLGSAHTLTVTHQPANERVVFAVSGGGIPTESRPLSYPAPTALPVQQVALRVETSPANCPADDGSPSERVEAMMDARFDNVRLNAAAVP
jgi:hypothetical protein